MKGPGFDSKDLDTAKHLLAELGTPDRKLRAQMIKRLRDIYVTKDYKVKTHRTNRGVKIIGSKDPLKQKKIRRKNKVLKGKMRIDI